MGHIVSASRRTDIPAFHADWFGRCVERAMAWSVNPFSGQARRVSLDPAEVAAIVFWSKDYRPLLPQLDELDRRGYRTLFHFTITGLPALLEPRVPPAETAAETARVLAGRYGPERVLWRFDPIVLTAETGPEETIQRFERLAAMMAGATRECYFSFMIPYAKASRNLAALGLAVRAAEPAERLEIARQLTARATAHSLALLTCCGDDLLAAGAGKAHCIDADLINRLFGPVAEAGRNATRRQCGCSASYDIGVYDSCGHGCLYCYACERPGEGRGRLPLPPLPPGEGVG